MKNYDVIICGGGTAGVPAAIAAARNGARTLVIEQNGHLGGTAVGGIPFLGSLDGQGRVVNQGLYLEILDRLKAENACFGYATGAQWNVEQHYEFSLVPFDPEVFKYKRKAYENNYATAKGFQTDFPLAVICSRSVTFPSRNR